MLETVRAFAGVRLADTGEESRFRSAHASYFADLAEVAYPQLWGPDEVEWTKRLDDDYDNLRQVLSWMAATGDMQRGLRMAGALTRFWARRRQIGEGMIWITRLLASDLTPSNARARALVGAALLGPAEGHSDLLEEAVAIYRQFGPDYELGVAINNLAVERWHKGRWEESRALYEERLEMAQAAGDQAAISLTSANLIRYFAEVEGDLDTAEQYGIEALEAARQYGSPELVVLSMVDCAYVRSLRGDHKLAESLLQEARVYYEMGDYELAHRHMIQAVEEERTWWSDGAATGWGSDTIERLRFMGLIEGARGNSHKATTILSATESARIQVQLTPGPRSQDLLDTTIAQLRATLGDEAFQSAWDRGAGMSRDETYDYALNLLDDA
jgi:tetratricopeptide (TPR) repeat protein